MSDKINLEENESNTEEKKSAEMTSRRTFLLSLGKWSAVIIGAVGAANLIEPPPAAGWVNGGGGSWVNGRGGGGAGWVNRNVGGGSWVNRNGGGGSWVNRNAGWVNGGGGGSWANSRGGWVNRL